MKTFDVIVVGGGPAGSTAATALARDGFGVLLLDRGGRPKPCGGAIPPRLVADFDIPDALLVARANCARMVAPSGRHVDMAIDDGFIGMVDRVHFDEWLRQRAVAAGALRCEGTFEAITRDEQGVAVVHWRTAERPGLPALAQHARARLVIGADGARSAVAKAALPDVPAPPCVFAYHEILRTPADAGDAARRCEVHYRGALSPDFYGWVFPHGETVSVGCGSADKGFSLRGAVGDLRRSVALDEAALVRREGAPLPMKPLARWDNGRDVLVVGDAAGVVAPASGEGIFYAMDSARLAALAGARCLRDGDARHLREVRRDFMRAHGRVFLILGVMQRFWYTRESRRERFVAICRDRDVQRLTFEAYMHKRLARRRPLAHVRIFFKDLAHLLGLVHA